MSRVLITGGFGYVGGRLAQHLAEYPTWTVSLGTRRPRPAPDWLPSAAVVHTNWSSEDELQAACRNVDAIVHLSGMNAQQCLADPVAALEVNGVCTARLIRAAASVGVRRFVHVSTAHVYASSLRGAITEASCPKSSHPYATSHLAGERSVAFAHEQRKIEGVIVRLSNSFGAPADVQADCWTLLVNALSMQAVSRRRLTLNSPGLQRRDFITLTDACRGIAHLLAVPAASLGDGLFNLGGQWSPTVLEMAQRLAQRCADTLGYDPPIERPAASAGEASDSLDFQVEKLAGTGFNLTRKLDAEIVALLLFCKAANAQLPSRQ